VVRGGGEDWKDVFEDDARFGEIGSLCDCLSEVAGLLLSFSLDGLYFMTGEFGGCRAEISVRLRRRWGSSLLEVVASDSGREEA